MGDRVGSATWQREVRVRIAVLGQLDLDGIAIEEGNRHPATRIRNLLCVVTAAAEVGERAVSTQELLRLLWPDGGHRNLVQPLRQAVYRARRLIGEERLVSKRAAAGQTHYEFVKQADDITDLALFSTAAALAASARDAGDLDRALEKYHEAVTLWRGDPADPFPDFPDMSAEMWFQPLLAQRRRVIESYAEVHLELGRHSEKLRHTLRAFLRGDQRFNEHLHAQYLHLLYRLGEHDEALNAFQEAARLLDRAHGLGPGIELHRMERRIRRRDPDLDWTPPQAPVVLPTVGGQGPTVRGVYDRTLGGKDNMESDREFVQDLIDRTGTDTHLVAGENRACIVRMVRWLCQEGIRQFMDLGSGWPEPGGRDVPRIARQVIPQVRILSVDNDQLAVLHTNALIADDKDVICRELDIQDVEAVLYEARAHLDFSEPIGLICANTLQYIPTVLPPPAPRVPEVDRFTDQVVAMMQRYVDALPAGSYLALTHLSDDRLDPEIKPHLDYRNPYAELPMHLRSPDQIERMFCGLPLVGEMTDVGAWRPEEPFTARKMRIIGGIAVKE
jgi:DNA-binding SARP family transcriptional activator